jgi:hypothetical protein
MTVFDSLPSLFPATLLEALVPGQGGGPNGLSVDRQPLTDVSMTL